MIDKNKLIAELDKLDCIRNVNDYTNNCNSHDDIVSTIEEMLEGEEFNSAEEMFEELGYKLIKNTPYLIYKRDDGGYITMLSFIDTCKRIFIEEYEEYNDNQPQGSTVIYMDTLKAINQQCKELGWFDGI